MNKNIWTLVAGLLSLALPASAGTIVYNAPLVSETALAHDQAYSVDLQSNGINQLSAQATYSSASVTGSSFQDGSQSTGSATVLDYASLSSASAVNQVTVVTNAGLVGSRLTLPGFVLREGVDWRVAASTALTAESLKVALAKVPFLSVSRVGSVVFATAAAGSYYNSTQLVASAPAALSVATPLFTGGRDNAVLSINGTQLRQGLDFTAATSNAATATSIRSAINASALLSPLVTAGGAGATVSLVSDRNGAASNFRLATSTPTALSVSGASMTGGADPDVTLGSPLIRVVGNSLTTALPVLYDSTGGTLGGLTDQTTYYAIAVDANSAKLASSASNAVAGTAITITSTGTQLTANTYSLTPLATTGNSSFKWQVSNTGSDWIDLAVSSVTVSPSSAPSSSIWSFGYIGTRYLRLNALAPTTGGLVLNVRLIGTN